MATLLHVNFCTLWIFTIGRMLSIVAKTKFKPIDWKRISSDTELAFTFLWNLLLVNSRADDQSSPVNDILLTADTLI